MTESETIEVTAPEADEEDEKSPKDRPRRSEGRSKRERNIHEDLSAYCIYYRSI